MEIIVEIGTDEQKKLIAKELEFIGIVARNCNPPISLTRVIVTAHFDATINRLEGISAYTSSRGEGENKINATARVTKDGDGYAIVVSSILYTQAYDFQVRCFIFLHEIAHLINKRDFPTIQPDHTARATYRRNLYNLFDEYYADRFALNLVDQHFPARSPEWQAYIDNDVTGLAAIVCDPFYYENSQEAIVDLLSSKSDLNMFLDITRRGFDEVATSIAHLFSHIHNDPDSIPIEKLSQSKFVNKKTIALMDYFKRKFEENSADLEDGLELVSEFMANFGVTFYDKDGQLHCNVVEI